MQILGVSLDSIEANAAFAQRYGFPFPLLSDLNRNICMAYQACDSPQAYTVERLTYIIGPDGRVLHAIHNLNAPEHPVAALRYLYQFLNPTGYVEASLVYALGSFGYDFGTETYRDFLSEAMWPADPRVHRYLLSYLDDHPEDAADLIWILNLDQTPVYAIRPAGAFTIEAYREMRQFLADQIIEGVERISVPGIMQGTIKLLSSQVVPVIQPAVQGMYSWTTEALLEAMYNDEGNEAVRAAVKNFLDRVYFERPNTGQMARDRAINYAATNAYQAQLVMSNAVQENIVLQSINAEPGVICRPDADCWDVVLTFVNPGQRFQRAQKVYRFTVDVSDIIPVLVGRIRSWYIYPTELLSPRRRPG